VGRELGLKIQDVGSGGASDANTTSTIGIPTLDGLGAAVAWHTTRQSLSSWIICQQGLR
jgi:hypothetical protein